VQAWGSLLPCGCAPRAIECASRRVGGWGGVRVRVRVPGCGCGCPGAGPGAGAGAGAWLPGFRVFGFHNNKADRTKVTKIA
jgi:hypothetical protein